MNIFYLDKNPKVAAQMMCDKHVVKMILESAQMLSTAHRVLDGDAYADLIGMYKICLLYTSPSPRDATLSRMQSSE